MAQQIILPKQGNTVESCVIMEWKVKQGDVVTAETPVAEVETDKATMEVVAGVAGTVLKLYYKEGDDVPVMTPIGVVGAPGEDISAFAVPAIGGAAPAAQAPAAVPEPLAPVAVSEPVHGDGRKGVSPRARNLAEDKGINTSILAGSGPGGRVIEHDVQGVVVGRPMLTKAAEELARSGIAVPASGTGIGGRVTTADMLSAKGGTVPTAAASAASNLEFPGASETTPIKGIRKRIADRMTESLATCAQLTMNASANAAKVMALRKRFKESDEFFGLSGITINDLVLFAVARTLPKFKYMNSIKKDGNITQFDHVHLGVALDTPRGLMVPVVRFADTLSLRAISAEVKRLAAACQNEMIQPDEMKGSTFTVTNFGSLGVESFTPVINIPETAILGVCTVANRPEIANGALVNVPYLGFSLTIDHCVIDGSPAAKFLKELSATIANIDIMLAL
jgi:pyruvate dehydrogenase E2 component (dihydrolipoamide acetyltransferase)